jgi:hypothetical protein
MGARGAAECTRWKLTSLGSVATKRFILLRMPKRRDCANKSVRGSISDLNRL